QRGAPLASRQAGSQRNQRAGPGEPGYPEHHRRWPQSASRPPERVNDAQRAQRSQRNDAVAQPLAQPYLDRLVGEGNEKKGSDPEAHRACASGSPAATQRSQNPDTMSVSDVPARLASASHADNSAKKASFTARLYSHDARLWHSSDLAAGFAARANSVVRDRLLLEHRDDRRRSAQTQLLPARHHVLVSLLG